MTRITATLYLNVCVHLWQHLAEFLFESEMLQAVLNRKSERTIYVQHVS